VNDTDVTKRFGVELRKATRQLVNEVVPTPMLACLADLQAAEQSTTQSARDVMVRGKPSQRR
jgi:hypothetical protein